MILIVEVALSDPKEVDKVVDEELDEKVDEEVEEEVDTISTAKPVGGVRRGRDAASHPRLACPMLQHCMPYSAL